MNSYFLWPFVVVPVLYFVVLIHIRIMTNQRQKVSFWLARLEDEVVKFENTFDKGDYLSPTLRIEQCVNVLYCFSLKASKAEHIAADPLIDARMCINKVRRRHYYDWGARFAPVVRRIDHLLEEVWDET